MMLLLSRASKLLRFKGSFVHWKTLNQWLVFIFLTWNFRCGYKVRWNLCLVSDSFHGLFYSYSPSLPFIPLCLIHWTSLLSLPHFLSVSIHIIFFFLCNNGLIWFKKRKKKLRLGEHLLNRLVFSLNITWCRFKEWYCPRVRV